MAGSDYIKCDDCGCKLLYDGDDNGRERLEQVWGNPDASEWTVGLLCPDCLGKLRKRIASLENALANVAWMAGGIPTQEQLDNIVKYIADKTTALQAEGEALSQPSDQQGGEG